MKWYSMRLSVVWIICSPFIFAGIVIAFQCFVWRPMKYDYERFVNSNTNQLKYAQRLAVQKEADLKLEQLKIQYYQQREAELNRIATRWQERAVTLETRQEAIFCALEEGRTIREAFEKIEILMSPSMNKACSSLCHEKGVSREGGF